MNEPQMRVLRVQSFGETEAENAQITLNPQMVQMTAAFHDTRQGRPVRRVNVLFVDGGSVELYVSDYDLLTLEEAIGAYGFLV